jgi:hypothetical protein
MGKGKSIPESEDDIHKNVQKALDQSIRQSPIAPNAIIPPRIGLLLDQQEMSTTMTTPAETVGYIKSLANQEQVKQAYDKVMKKYKPPEGMGPLGGSGMPPGKGGAPGGGGGPPGGGENPGQGNPPDGGNPACGI